MKQEQLVYLVDRLVNKTITAEEKVRLLELLTNQDDTELAETGVSAWLDEQLPVLDLQPDDAIIQQQLNAILSVDKIAVTDNIRPLRASRKWYWAAAVAALLVTTATYQLLKKPQKTTTIAQQLDMPPGKEGAVLTLADGSKLVLDSMKQGQIASQNGTRLVLKEGQLTYDASAAAPDQMVYNTVNTPRGRQFQLTLPDGTRVWMNAASSVRYPNNFDKRQRKVMVSGEVYFEVASNPGQPFIVEVEHRATVEVLGTHFDVNAYDSDSHEISTTLLEGAVKVSNGTHQSILRPGQQAQIGAAISIVNNVNTDQVVAWKNGFFNFENMRLKEVMSQLERWYNIEVVYEGVVPDVRLFGELRRDMNLSGIISALSDSGVHFRIEGNKLIVLP